MSKYISVDKKLVRDKPLPEGFLWHLREDGSRFASIRKLRDDDEGAEMVFGLERRLGFKVNILKRTTNGGNAVIETLDDGVDVIEQAVNCMYAHFMLGDTST